MRIWAFATATWNTTRSYFVSAAPCWETEKATEILRAGEMILILKGIFRRSMLCDYSEEENILLERKIRDQLTYVGDGEPATG